MQGSLEVEADVDFEKLSLDKATKSKYNQYVKQHETLSKQKIDLDKQQKVFNELVDQEHELAKLQKEYQSLSDKVANTRGDLKTHQKLVIEQNRKGLEIKQKNLSIKEGLKTQGTSSIETLKDKILAQSKTLQDGLAKSKQHFDTLVSKSGTLQKAALEIAEKQLGKRFISLMMKAVPGLNIISNFYWNGFVRRLHPLPRY